MRRSFLLFALFLSGCIEEMELPYEQSDSGWGPAGEPAQPASEPSGEPSYQGPTPNGSLPGCWVVDPDGSLGIVNAGLYCFENADITYYNCSASYLEYDPYGCPSDGIIASCSNIPVEGDYVAISTGYWYEGAVGSEDACGYVDGTYEGMSW